MVTDSEKVFEARYYLAESNRLKKQSALLEKQADEFLELSVLAWKKVAARE